MHISLRCFAVTHGLFWEQVGPLSFVKPKSHITRFWTRFWGVPLFEALPSGWLDIPNHFMKGRNDHFGSGLVVTLGGFVRLVCNQVH